MFVSLNSIYVANVLKVVDNNVALLAFYNSLIAVILFFPLIFFTGEHFRLINFLSINTRNVLLNFLFWMLLAGLFGFLISIVTNLQIKHTSPLTHNISGTAKACVQTILATYIFNEPKTIRWWLSNIIVLVSSALYTFIRQREMQPNIHLPKKSDQEENNSLLINIDTNHSNENEEN